MTYYEKNKEKIKAYARERYYQYKKDPERYKKYLKDTKEYVEKWRKNNPERIKAQRVVFGAIRNGTLKKKSCEICGLPKTEAHHNDYSKPLEVLWLCRSHHLIADADRRRSELSTGLLDS